MATAVFSSARAEGLSDPPAITLPSADGLSLDGRFEMLIDPSRSLTLDDVLAGAGGNFQPHGGHGVNLGYTTTGRLARGH